jgi:hypothetical protein
MIAAAAPICRQTSLARTNKPKITNYSCRKSMTRKGVALKPEAKRDQASSRKRDFFWLRRQTVFV